MEEFMEYVKGLVCLNCGATYEIEPLFAGCLACEEESFRVI